MAEPQQKVERKDKPTAAEKSRRLGWRFGAGAALATTALVAALAFQRCGAEPQVEGPAACPPAVTCPAAPAKGDNLCELEKGEHDSRSENWDPESCGYCGDRIQQEWETPQFCPVDFACGDGEVQRRAKVYGAIVRTMEGENASYSIGTLEVTESCNERDANYCEADCPAKSTGRAAPRRDRDRPAPVATATKQPPRASGGACDSSVTANATSLYSRVIRQVGSASGSIKSALQAEQAPVSVSVRVRISESGVPTVVGASASCGGSPCRGSADIVSLAGVNVGGISVSNGGPACTMSVPVSIR
jgi:hypothetical protein